jgi:hypothetical protein
MDHPLKVPPAQQANTFHTHCLSCILKSDNDLLIDVVKQQLSQGLEAWRKVDLLYQSTSSKVELHNGHDCDNWVRKLCNNIKKPTEAQEAMAQRGV